MRCKKCGNQMPMTNIESVGYAAIFTGIGLLLYFLPEWLFGW